MRKKQYKEKYFEEIRQQHNISRNEIVLLYVGRLIKEKGIQDVIHVIDKLRKDEFPIKLLVVGDGIYRNELEDLSINSNGIIFTGEIGYEELPKYCYASDILVLPTYDDVWGLTINEGMACGLPIITSTSAGAYLDLIYNNGCVYEAGNKKALESCIQNCIGFEKMNSQTNQIQLARRRLKILVEQSVNIIKV